MKKNMKKKSYPDSFLEDAENLLGSLLCYAEADGWNAQDFLEQFFLPLAAEKIDSGEGFDPCFVSGLDPSEAYARIVGHETKEDFRVDDSPDVIAYWLGNAYAFAQWYLDVPFCELIQAANVEKLKKWRNAFGDPPFPEASLGWILEKLIEPEVPKAQEALAFLDDCRKKAKEENEDAGNLAFLRFAYAVNGFGSIVSRNLELPLEKIRCLAKSVLKRTRLEGASRALDFVILNGEKWDDDIRETMEALAEKVKELSR